MDQFRFPLKPPFVNKNPHCFEELQAQEENQRKEIEEMENILQAHVRNADVTSNRVVDLENQLKEKNTELKAMLEREHAVKNQMQQVGGRMGEVLFLYLGKYEIEKGSERTQKLTVWSRVFTNR